MKVIVVIDQEDDNEVVGVYSGSLAAVRRTFIVETAESLDQSLSEVRHMVDEKFRFEAHELQATKKKK